jgi:hypothetical protein
VNYHPLVVPTGEAASFFEHLRLGHEAGSKMVHHRVVETDEGQVELGNNHVDVVAGVADQGPALVVAR